MLLEVDYVPQADAWGVFDRGGGGGGLLPGMDQGGGLFGGFR